MKVSSSILVVASFPAAHAWNEFGRRGYAGPMFQRKRVIDAGLEQGAKKTSWMDAQQLEGARILEEFEEIMDGEISLSLSMSYGSFGPPPTKPPTMILSTRPSMTPSSIPSDLPSMAPSQTGNVIPTTLAPSVINTVEVVSPLTPPPSSAFIPNPSSFLPTGEPKVFDCQGSGLSLGSASDAGTTAIFLTVGYRAESTSNLTDDFLGELERQLLEAAVVAALACDNDGGVRRRLRHATRQLLMETLVVGSCDPSLDVAKSCTIMETELSFFLNGEIDPDAAAHAGYVAIEENMTNDHYVGVVPTIVKLEYLSPLPLPTPPQFTGDGSSTDPPIVLTSNRDSKLSVSPWTIGACAATIMGGLISMVVWARNRRSRQRRHHVQLGENRSLVDSGSRNPMSI